jgi:hypothetical protein
MAVNDIHSVALVQDYEDYKPVNVFHYIETVDGAGDANASLNAAFNTAVLFDWADCVSTAMGLLCLIGKTIHPAPTRPNVFSPLAATAGTKVGASMPGQTQAVVRKYPVAGGVPYLVGHYNLGGTIEADWTEGQMSAGLNTLIVALNADLEGTLVSGGYTFEPVIWSPTRKKAATPPFHIGWDTSQVNFGVKVLRRRRGFYHSFA